LFGKQLYCGIFVCCIVRSDWYDIKFENVFLKVKKFCFIMNFFYLNSNKIWLIWYKKCKIVKIFFIYLFIFERSKKKKRESWEWFVNSLLSSLSFSFLLALLFPVSVRVSESRRSWEKGEVKGNAKDESFISLVTPFSLKKIDFY
jgi:RsiW-degrading membrane proteinase PrsW (M82 family)